VGMQAGAGLPFLEADWVRPGQICFDFVYHPLETPFLAAARARGARCIDGLALLVAQARESFTIWTGQTFDLHPMHEAVARAASGRGEG
jgi:shikimate dehydrogenase